MGGGGGGAGTASLLAKNDQYCEDFQLLSVFERKPFEFQTEPMSDG